MKKTTLSIAIGLLLVANAGVAKPRQMTLEQRLEMLETRLEAAENRAAQAESKVQQLQVQQAAEIKEIKAAQGNTPVNGEQPASEVANNASKPTLNLSGYGDIKFYGDVEFNMDAESKHGVLAATSGNFKPDNTNETWNLNGRILLGFDGMRQLGDGYYAGFSAQPLGDMQGVVNIDDAVFFFGRQDDWKIKVGRFEAYDMFPLNQDTFVEHSGNTANDLYDDGSGYIYMMKEGRGRSDAGGNFLMSKQMDNWYFELNTLFEDGTSLYNSGDEGDHTYHGREMEQQKNVIYMRPVIAYTQDELTVSAAMESNVVDGAYGYTDANGKFIDQSDRTGYGLTLTWNGQKTDPENGVVVNLNTAYLDANNEKDFTAGINALWRNFELGYIYAHNTIDDYAGVIKHDKDDWIYNEGTYDIHTIHASYLIPNVMNMKNFNVYLGAYYSMINSDNSNQNGYTENDDRYGGRIRFKYYF